LTIIQYILPLQGVYKMNTKYTVRNKKRTIVRCRSCIISHLRSTENIHLDSGLFYG